MHVIVNVVDQVGSIGATSDQLNEMVSTIHTIIYTELTNMLQKMKSISE